MSSTVSSESTVSGQVPLFIDRRLWRITHAIAMACLAIGVVTRLSPLLDIDGRLFWQYMTEDGYLMQTVARNMAIGLGMTTADGTIPTNGVQPLATVLFAFLHWLAEGERDTSISLVMIVSAVISISAAFMMYCLFKQLLSDRKDRDDIALLIAAVWFVGPLTTLHHMNGLETGLYVACMLGTLLFYFSRESLAEALSPRNSMILGVLLGVTFLARNDAVFFIAALLLAHLLIGKRDLTSLLRRLRDCLLAGIVSIAVGAPWMLYNFNLYGTIVPISGLSQSHGATFGQNLPIVPSSLLEVAIPFLPLPGAIQTLWPVIAISVLLIGAIIVIFWRQWAKESQPRQKYMFVMVFFMAALAGYYGLFFGAPHFVPRYLSILSPYLWFASATVAISLLMMIRPISAVRGQVVAAAMLAVCVMAVGVSLHFYQRGTSHMHKQVVQWVERHVRSDQWVGAVQTGTLGYFHDRTLNLDGKVNPRALRALQSEGHVLNYVMETPIAYIADWHGVAYWPTFPQADRFGRVFITLVRDEAANLGVLKRAQ